MVKAVIVDDELHARESLNHMLRTYCPTVHVVGEAERIEEAYEVILKSKPDLVFLDMQLTDGLGFDLLRRFDELHFKVIIISAYQEFAIKAFKFSAVDYLLKPIDPDDLARAVDNALSKVYDDSQQQSLNALIENTKNPEKKDKLIVLRNSEETYIVNTSEIVRCESDNNSTNFILADKSRIRVTKTLKEFEELLEECGFVRCHQSHLVNRHHIEKIIRFPSLSLQMDNGDSIPVSFRKRKQL
ncbi:LytR/AlgR family response regulator transcription factor [Tenuifilum thalassicum]|uniref:Response regulator transcription factor n=1 Tax=Tenuifilum thalassicum TaxID=2590900 RepID=A0A7D4C0V7_9BACT|nr:LytTR family DNA-binding domain-containing protein [Tenuifilum thalassicum]QKG80304.1 response regulator transcription factor [Tenuifilum thalassicum]